MQVDQYLYANPRGPFADQASPGRYDDISVIIFLLLQIVQTLFVSIQNIHHTTRIFSYKIRWYGTQKFFFKLNKKQKNYKLGNCIYIRYSCLVIEQLNPINGFMNLKFFIMFTYHKIHRFVKFVCLCQHPTYQLLFFFNSISIHK